MVKKASLLVSLFTCLKIYAQQNLVQNWSFEDTVSCPSFAGQLNNASYWINPCTNINGSPDYYKGCCSIAPCTTPNNSQGNQIPKMGTAYAGFYASQLGAVSPEAREYVETKLIDTLQAGKQYCVQFHLSLSEGSQYSTDKVQCLFSDTLITTNNSGTVLNYAPQLENSIGNFLSDKINWMQFENIYTAAGLEQYIVIGNFYNDAATDTQTVIGGSFNSAYYYIDNVSIVEITSAFAGNDTTYCSLDTAKIGGLPTFAAEYYWNIISGSAQMDSNNIAQPKAWANSSGTSTFVLQKTQCSIITYDTVSITFSCVGIKETPFDDLFSVFPNPANNEIIIKSISGFDGIEISLKDIAGREINKIIPTEQDAVIISTEGISSGVYFLSLTKYGRSISKKIFILH